MICPRDNGKLEIRVVNDVILEVCETCSVVWLSRGSIDEIRVKHNVNFSDITEMPAKISLSTEPAVCPEHHKPMKLVCYQHIEVDVCEECRGIWLDPGELKKIVTLKKHQKRAKQQQSEVMTTVNPSASHSPGAAAGAAAVSEGVGEGVAEAILGLLSG